MERSHRRPVNLAAGANPTGWLGRRPALRAYPRDTLCCPCSTRGGGREGCATGKCGPGRPARGWPTSPDGRHLAPDGPGSYCATGRSPEPTRARGDPVRGGTGAGLQVGRGDREDVIEAGLGGNRSPQSWSLDLGQLRQPVGRLGRDQRPGGPLSDSPTQWQPGGGLRDREGPWLRPPGLASFRLTTADLGPRSRSKDGSLRHQAWHAVR